MGGRGLGPAVGEWAWPAGIISFLQEGGRAWTLQGGMGRAWVPREWAWPASGLEVRLDKSSVEWAGPGPTMGWAGPFPWAGPRLYRVGVAQVLQSGRVLRPISRMDGAYSLARVLHAVG